MISGKKILVWNFMILIFMLGTSSLHGQRSEECVVSREDTTFTVTLEAEFFVDDVCSRDILLVAESSTISSGTIVSRDWLVNGWYTASGANPVIKLDSARLSTIILTVESDEGCIDTAVASFRVHPLPQADFAFDTTMGCGPLEVGFYDSSLVDSGMVDSWSWDFGNGVTSLDQDAIVTLTESGYHGVSLTAITSAGCESTKVLDSVTYIYPDPGSDFSFIVHGDSAVDFSDLSSDSAVSWMWDFGDGNTDTNQNPGHSFDTIGIYKVCLTTISNRGCTDSICRNVEVKEPIGVNDELDSQDFLMYPNPASNIVYIYGAGENKLMLHIYNVLGECIYSNQIVGTDVISLRLNEIGIPAGNYVLRVTGRVNAFTQNLIKVD